MPIYRRGQGPLAGAGRGSAVATEALRTAWNADEGQRADDGANIPSLGLTHIVQVYPIPAEWESYQQLYGTVLACGDRELLPTATVLLWQRGREQQSQGLMPCVPKPPLSCLGALGYP